MGLKNCWVIAICSNLSCNLVWCWYDLGLLVLIVKCDPYEDIKDLSGDEDCDTVSKLIRI